MSTNRSRPSRKRKPDTWHARENPRTGTFNANIDTMWQDFSTGYMEHQLANMVIRHSSSDRRITIMHFHLKFSNTLPSTISCIYTHIGNVITVTSIITDEFYDKDIKQWVQLPKEPNADEVNRIIKEQMAPMQGTSLTMFN